MGKCKGMTVKELLDDFQLFKGKIYVYQGWDTLELDVDDNEEILLNAEVVEYEINYGALYIKIN